MQKSIHRKKKQEHRPAEPKRIKEEGNIRLKGELYTRLQILEDGGLTSDHMTAYCKQMIELILEEKPDVDGERFDMFVTHLAMTMQRVRTGQQENPIDSQVLETVKMDVAYPRAEALFRKIFSVCGAKFPQTEQDFLKAHLCNLFT